MDAPVDAGGLGQLANRMVARAWADEVFKERLLADPVAAIRAAIECPAHGASER